MKKNTMKISVWQFAGILLIFFPMIMSCDSQDSSEPELVWSDEFNYSGHPDTSKWAYEQGMIRNNEAQYYTKRRLKNARVEDGNLVIEAHKEDYQDADYTSASINTFNKKHFRYGRIEVRAKVPTGKGTWPAIWMLGTNIPEVGWPECGEIDILEYVGYDPHKVHANIHTDAYNHVEGTGKGNSITLDKPWENFHTYAIEWRENRIDFFVDTTKYFTFKNDGEGNNATWPFDKPHYLLINLAIGGSWGGQQGINDEKFPHQYYIDYVRVYDLKQ
jgi:beta-glucanase (GH16 family)